MLFANDAEHDHRGASDAPASGSMSRCNRLPGDRAHVLVIDDESYVRDLVARWLTCAGHACTAVDRVCKAREHIRNERVDLATIDIRMPECSGLELLRDLAEHPDEPADIAPGDLLVPGTIGMRRALEETACIL